MEEFSEKLLNWYHKNKRDLPWRGTKNPYKIWLSEIILQQTRVEQGWNYYLAFIESYPTVEDLANASEQEVLKLWQGLGYYSRARNLHFTAKDITENRGGKFPTNYKDLLKLKGVGKYTAAAIASFAYSEAVAAIDGNVYRVLSRVFGEYETINTPKAEKKFQELAMQILPVAFAGDFNQAMMELGAVVCKPQNPMCEQCPVDYFCWAKKTNKQADFPVKKAGIKIKKRYFNYFLLNDDDKIVLRKREKKDIWRHLFEFPLVECEEDNFSEFRAFLDANFGIKVPIFKKINETPIIHKLSHQHIFITFWRISNQIEKIPHDAILISKKEFSLYPMPIVLADFIDNKNADF